MARAPRSPISCFRALTWNALFARVTQAANLFRKLGIGESDVVAYILPNTMETAVTLLGGAVAGIVNPINPLLEPEQISAILRETGAKVVVTLRAFPKTDLPQKVAEAVRHAPSVKTVIEVDMVRSLGGAKKFIVPLIRPDQVAPRNSLPLALAKLIAGAVGARVHSAVVTPSRFPETAPTSKLCPSSSAKVDRW